MFDSQCDLAALVYEQDQDPDQILRDFAVDLNGRGYRAVGLVQLGHHCVDAPKLSAMLVHTGEELQLFQDLGTCAKGCRLDVGQLLDAGGQVASAIDQGADLVIVNRSGRQEREGKGLSYLVERALSADIPVVIAGTEPPVRGLDQIRRWLERETPLQPRGTGYMVGRRLGAKRRAGRPGSPDLLRSSQIGPDRQFFRAFPAFARIACRRT
jgi:hypothetical protein